MSRNGPPPALFPGPSVSYVPRDRLNRPLRTGQIVTFHQPFDMICKVESVTPILHPNAAPGTVEVVLSIDRFATQMMGGHANPTVIVLADRPDAPAIASTEEPDALTDG